MALCVVSVLCGFVYFPIKVCIFFLVGKVLATYEENTRDFLFPDPKLTHGRCGLEREILMKRSPFFTGIAPKLRFSTTSLISDSLLSLGRSHIQAGMNLVHHSTLHGKMHSKLPKKIPLSAGRGRQGSAGKGYEQPTIASKSRSPSPYTRRRMCELSEEARQRLAHLNLGPHEFRRDTDRPPFVIRRVGQPGPGAKLHSWCSLRESASEAWPKAPHDLSPLNSYRPKKTEAKSTSGEGLDSSVCKEDVSPAPLSRESRSAASLEHSAAPAVQEPSPSSVLDRSSLRERFSTGWPSPPNGDEIHKRVKNILKTHSARQRLIFDDLPQTREPSVNVPLTMSELRSSPPPQRNAPVRLDSGECWSGPAAVYKEKPHRAILEETLAKMYRNMYQKTAGAVSDHKTYS
uniref:Spermatogenesis associated 6 n=1 Tax=Cyanoderma ruficeps TaxID=181631 RepID=A0A8C3QY86_9PASS